jgi:hypothetical protein
MVERCLADQSPFGVVLIREGREVGGGELAVAGVGTVAEIREATRYADGRYDLVTLGTLRFRLDGVDPAAEPYLVGQITPLGEVLGQADRAKLLGERVVQLFIRYLEMLQVDEAAGGRERGRNRRGRRERPMSDVGMEGLGHFEVAPEAAGEPWAIDADDLEDTFSDAYDAAEREAAEAAAFEAAALAAAEADAAEESLRLASASDSAGGVTSGATQGDSDGSIRANEGSDPADRAREALLDEAARRLTIPEDPTVLSYLLSGIVQVESIRRQGLLEMPTTELRLVELAHLLEREIALLERGLGTYTPDPRLASLRRN